MMMLQISNKKKKKKRSSRYIPNDNDDMILHGDSRQEISGREKTRYIISLVICSPVAMLSNNGEIFLFPALLLLLCLLYQVS